ncbi:ABC transporter substrate-binding protein [Halapricum desulfuricans]|uniref:ABC-type sugar transport system, periplasmic component n=1 Tax=Halapricum desulfuricans TaxID=2841257 RepID=A0A897NBA4_9EURY|nr:extracellular solute-binding protein [Halapricum desulfuricans]QSG09942.1 ABC-type sugar transport system, periplasmic component [Halapricum desulfuricans]
MLKGLGVGAAAGLAGCNALGGNGNGNGGQALMWEYGFPNTEGAEPVWRNKFESKYEELAGEEIKISRYSYEDLRQKFLTGASTGDPDAIEGSLSHLSEYIAAGHVEPLDDLAESLDHFDGYVDSTIEAMTYQDTLYALPYEGNARAFFVRQDILDELGQDVPESAEAFHEIGRMINDEYDDLIGFHNCTKDGSVRAFQEWMTHIYQHTDQLYVPDGDSWQLNIEADALGQVFDNWYYQIYAADNPVGDPDDLGTGWQTNDPGYINGNYAFIESGTWMRNWTTGENIQSSDTAEDILNNKTQIAHPPRADGASKGTFLEVKPVMVNTHSDQIEKGKTAVEAYTHPETLSEGMAQDPEGSGKAMTPVHDNVESTIENENWQPLTDIFTTGRALAKATWGPVREEFYTYMQEVSYGETDPYDAGEQFHEALQDLESEI